MAAARRVGRLCGACAWAAGHALRAVAPPRRRRTLPAGAAAARGGGAWKKGLELDWIFAGRRKKRKISNPASPLSAALAVAARSRSASASA